MAPGRPFKDIINKVDSHWLSELSRLLPEIRVARPELSPPNLVRETAQRQALYDALSGTLLYPGRPLLLLFDDIQWSDAESLEWLHYLLRRSSELPFMVLATARIEDLADHKGIQTLLSGLHRMERVTEIPVKPLSKEETLQLIDSIAEAPIAPEAALALYDETEGNPLFIVEMLRARAAQAEEEASSSPPDAGGWPIPPKLHSLIENRLARLSPDAKLLSALAATIGRRFSFRVLAEASRFDEDRLIQNIEVLWQGRIIREQGGDGYDFSHDKIREAAYAALSTPRKRQYHRRIAEAFEALRADGIDVDPAQLAYHYDQADRMIQALAYYEAAAEGAQEIYANQKAIDLIDRALEILQALPEATEKTARSLRLHEALGASLVAVRGYGAFEVSQAYQRAEALSARLGQPPSPPILRGLAIASLVRGDLGGAQRLGEALLARAGQEADRQLDIEAHYVLGVTAFWWGHFQEARQALETALKHARPEHSAAHLSLFSQDPEIVCAIRLAYTLWFLGFPDQARARCASALRQARALSHPFSLAYALNFATWLHHDCGDDAQAAQYAEAAATLSAEQSLGFLLPMGRIFQGWLRCRRGDTDEGGALIEEGLRRYFETGQHLYRPYALVLSARACIMREAYPQALAALNEGFSVADHSEIRFWDAELYRCKGELLCSDGRENEAEAETDLMQALKIARNQGSLSLALRAAISLFRLFHDQKDRAKKTKAFQILQEKYAGFNEGFDTGDLKAARTLLKK